MDILWLGSRHGLNDFEQVAIIFVLVAAFISLVYAWWLRGTVLKKDKGTAKMQEVWNAIRVGADCYLSRQLKTILPLIGCPDGGHVLERLRCPAQSEAQEEFAAFGRAGHHTHHCHRTHDCLYHGRFLFLDGRPMGHAHGGAGQCARGFRLPPWI